MEQAYSILYNHLSFPHILSLLIVFIATLAVDILVLKRRWTHSLLISLFVTYIFFILLITLIARTPAAEPHIKLIPFWSWYEVIAHHDRGLLVEIILNVVLFVPVGILSRLVAVARLLDFPLRRVPSLRTVAIFSLFFSLAIEVTQYFTCLGLCEIFDDVIGNTVGGVIGYGICGYVMRISRRRGNCQ